ncbi:MAG TPA: hypothetical protein VMW62_11725 [Chloroflexota bacterium]|nr:hypothetical protein [Chloroflexota bacterium]
MPAEPLKCQGEACERNAIVYLGGRPLCYQHYVDNVNELNQLGLTPRGLTEARESINGSPPVERLIREPARPPERKPEPLDKR